MNAWQIVGGVLSIVGTILMFYGSHLQVQGDQKFQEKVEGYVENQQAQESPELIALEVLQAKSDFELTVKNVGRKPATKVKVIYSQKSTPSVFAANQISGASEIPQNTEYKFHLNLFTGIELMMKLPNSDPIYKEVLQDSLNRFDAGDMAFIPRFNIEYYHGETRVVSPTYYLVLEKRNGQISLRYFGKDD